MGTAVPQGHAHSRTVALGATLLVHLALGVGLWRLTADALHPGQSAPVMQVVWIDAPSPPPPVASVTAAPQSPPMPSSVSRTSPPPAGQRRPALQAVDVTAPTVVDAPPTRPSLQDQASALARSAAPVGSFAPDPLRHRPPPRADGRFAMHGPVSAQEVVHGIGALFGGGPSDPCPRIREHLANADMGAGRALANEEIERLRRNCL